MRQWPEDPRKTVRYDDVIRPIMASIQECYTLIEKPTDGLPYDGLPICAPEDVSTPGAEHFTAEVLADHREHYGVTPMELLVKQAYLLGMEQGRRSLRGRREGAYSTLEIDAAFEEVLAENPDLDTRETGHLNHLVRFRLKDGVDMEAFEARLHERVHKRLGPFRERDS